MAKGQFSLIVALYNVEEYVDSFFRSIEIGRYPIRDLDIIVVDDGSSDGSLSIVQRWAEKYPNAIRVVSKENGGPGSARNVGLDLARNTWISFPDPDDTFHRDYLQNVADYLERDRSQRIRFVSTRIVQHEDGTARTNHNHPLDWKFKTGNRMIDLSSNPNFVHLSGGTAFVQREVVDSYELRFDEDLRPKFEDAHFIGRYLLLVDRPVVAVLASARYFYRKRSDGSSLIQGSWNTDGVYDEVPRLGYLNLLKTAKIQHGYVPQWVQSMVLYELVWAYAEQKNMHSATGSASSDLKNHFLGLFDEIMSHIDIATVSNFAAVGQGWIFHNVLLSHLIEPGLTLPAVVRWAVDPTRELIKYSYLYTGEQPSETIEINGQLVLPIHDKIIAHDFFGRQAMYERVLVLPYGEPRMLINGVQVPVVAKAPIPTRGAVMPLGMARKVEEGAHHRIVALPRKVPTSAEEEVAALAIEEHGNVPAKSVLAVPEIVTIPSVTSGHALTTTEATPPTGRGTNAAISDAPEKLHVNVAGGINPAKVSSVPEEVRIASVPATSKLPAAKNASVLRKSPLDKIPGVSTITKKVKGSNGKLVLQAQLQGTTRSGAAALALERLGKRVTKKATDKLGLRRNVVDKDAVKSPEMSRLYKKAWILMDRLDRADDNAEHLYRYLAANRPDINAWFVIEEDSDDWHRLKDDGFKLLPYGTEAAAAALFHASFNISSHADRSIQYPPFHSHFGDSKAKIVFLQHGVTKDDLSRWLNPKRIALMITATDDEQQSIVGDHTNYKLTSAEVSRTGFPRHDQLRGLVEANRDQARHNLLFAPTWRQYLTEIFNSEMDMQGQVAHFETSTFGKNWLGLLRDPELESLAKSNDLKVRFLAHPNLTPIVPSLDLPDHVEVLTYSSISVQEELVAAAVVVSDFSSLAFDGALAEANIVHFQFDGDEIFGGGHVYRKGYFDYQRDGFGPRVEEPHDVVLAIEDMAKRGFEIDEKFAHRIHMTFAYWDQESAKRTTTAIEDLNRPWWAAESSTGE